MIVTMLHNIRHPELVSGSISPIYTPVSVARWMLKQVQHDEVLCEGFAL